MPTTNSANDDVFLEAATDTEMLAVLGAYALPLVQGPGVTLSEGRSGAFVVDGSDALGKEFQHGYFENVARRFLKAWARQLGRALCGTGRTYSTIRRRALAQTDVVAGVIGASIAQQIPVIAPYTGLITVLSMLIVKTGIEGFCGMLNELQEEAIQIGGIASPEATSKRTIVRAKSRTTKPVSKKEC